jgi:hypothetical protein
MLSGASYLTSMLVFRTASNYGPIFFPNVRIDFNQPRIKAISASLLASGNPILFARF